MSFWRTLFKRTNDHPLDEKTHTNLENIISNAYVDPYLGADLVSAHAINSLSREGEQLKVSISLNYPAATIQKDIIEILEPALSQLEAFESVAIDIQSNIPAHMGQRAEASRIKNIIAISSGKGGVGKSTTTVNLALALAAEGASVGILDADLYGPSQPHLLGIPEGTRPQTRDMRHYAPLNAHGLKLMSMGLMVNEDTPMMWRGPVASETIQQLINQTLWGDMDYLLIDMPPGTGDIHITLAQTLAIAGAVVVTTPQDISLLDAQKGISMFNSVDVPVLGVIENMASHICTHCGHSEAVFGQHGGEKMARENHSELLGSLPLQRQIREQADAGLPIVLAEPDGEIAKLYKEIALRIAVNVAQPGLITPLPKITFVDD